MDFETLIEKLQQDLCRERGHMHFYLLASSTVRGLHREELSELFADEAKSEMGHVREFQALLIGLTTKRNLDFKINTNSIPDVPFDNQCPVALLKHAVEMEDEVVLNYTQRIEDAIQLQSNGGEDAVDGKWIELFLEGQIEDSRHDADNLREMIPN